MRINAGGDAQENVRRFPGHFRDFFKRVQFIGAVHDNVPDAKLYGIGEIRVRLVIAMEKDALHRKSCGMRGVKLSGRYAVRVHLLLRHHAVQLSEAKRFSGKHRRGAGTEMGGKRVLIESTLLSHGVHIEIIRGRAEFHGQFCGIQTGDGQMPGFVYGKGRMQKHGGLLTEKFAWYGVTSRRR